MKAQIRPAIVSFVVLTLVTGIVYPCIITVIAQAAFHEQANGSIIARDSRAVGSNLIGQPFTNARYFWSRPSACSYDAAAGAGSNLGPSNPALADAIRQRRAVLKTANPMNATEIPIDLLTASASGLDPHISPEAAIFQIQRVAAARGISEADIRRLVDQMTENRTFGILGEPRINVLQLNLALDVH